MEKEDIFDDIESYVVRVAALKSVCYDEIKKIQDKLTDEINNLRQLNQHLFIQDNKSKRKSIPKAIKNKCWDINIGMEKGIGGCTVCGTTIYARHFEAGHVISAKNGGGDNVSNLKPVCEECNKYMGSKNMDEYINEINQLMK